MGVSDDAPTGVNPARAGMIRIILDASVGVGSKPRASGDDPIPPDVDVLEET